MTEAERVQLLILGELNRRLACIPDRLAPLIAAEPDLTKRREILRREFDAIADDLAQAAAGLFEKLDATEH